MIAYGGSCKSEFALSCSALFVGSMRKRNDVAFSQNGIFFESLISRARNVCGSHVLHAEYTHLLFVDADIVFKPDDVLALLDADVDVACGPYAKKYISKQKLAYAAKFSPECLGSNQWVDALTDASTELDVKDYQAIKSGANIIEVDYAATGFMLIKKSVFEKIAAARPDLEYKNDIDGYMGLADKYYNFFPSNINPDSKKYESEDYGFCNLWRSIGGKIHVIPSIKLEHLGNQSFGLDLVRQSSIFNFQN